MRFVSLSGGRKEPSWPELELLDQIRANKP
jgi:hypothetical protein